MYIHIDNIYISQHCCVWDVHQGSPGIEPSPKMCLCVCAL